MSVPDPQTPRDWALLCVAQWGRSEEFPGHPFPQALAHAGLETALGTVRMAIPVSTARELGRKR